MLTGNLPVDEMKDVKLRASSEIDTGNRLLGKVEKKQNRRLEPFSSKLIVEF